MSSNTMGPSLKREKKIIEDGYKYNGTDDDKLMRYEQSDMVILLLNIAYIPDDVVRSINFHKHGWSKTFKKSMEDHKMEFNKKKGKIVKKWCYQGENDLEEKYN